MTELISCTNCGTKNRIPEQAGEGVIKCGKCKTGLPLNGDGQKESDMMLNLRCASCRTKNRVPLSMLDKGPKCGKCQSLLDTDDVYTDRVIQVTDTNFEDKIQNSPLPVLMYCWATFCTGCKAVSPVINALPKDTKGKVRVAKLNIESNPELAAKFNILSIPWLFIFDNGEVKENMPGISDKHQLLLKMANYI